MTERTTDYTLVYEITTEDDLTANFSFFLRYLKAGGVLKIWGESPDEPGTFGVYNVVSYSDSYIQLTFMAYNNAPLLYVMNITSAAIYRASYNLIAA